MSRFSFAFSRQAILTIWQLSTLMYYHNINSRIVDCSAILNTPSYVERWERAFSFWCVLRSVYFFSVLHTFLTDKTIEKCSKRSAYVTFRRKWVFGKYGNIICRSLFWQNFGWFDPSSAGIWIGGKMLETYFHVCQITRCVIMITFQKYIHLSYSDIHFWNRNI